MPHPKPRLVAAGMTALAALALLTAAACASNQGKKPPGTLGGGRVKADEKLNLDSQACSAGPDCSAFRWLADHQNETGFWRADRFLEDSNRIPSGAQTTGCVDFAADLQPRRLTPNDIGSPSSSLAVTGLALLSFLGDGHTDKESPYANPVRRAIKAIKASQQATGQFGSDDLYDSVLPTHSVCTMAMAELYDMTGARSVRPVATAAAAHLTAKYSALLPADADLEALPAPSLRGDDLSVVSTAWAVLALKSAVLADVVESEVSHALAVKALLRRMAKWIGRGVMPWREGPPVCQADGYETHPTAQACELFTSLFSGRWTPESTEAKAHAEVLRRDLPRWGSFGSDGEANGAHPWGIDLEYWLFGSYALFQMGDDCFGPWSKATGVLDRQRGHHAADIATHGEAVTKPSYPGDDNPDAGRRLLDEHGSWDPLDSLSAKGGRVYSTAMTAIILQVLYRYRKISAPTPANK